MPAEALPDFLGGEARGCVPVHPALRSGFAPIDNELLATLPMGCGARAAATLPAAVTLPPAAAALGPLRVRALFYSGAPCELSLSAHWHDAAGAVLGAALAPGASACAVAAPTELPLTTRPARATRLALAAHNEDGWKERTVLWEVEGLASHAWEVTLG